MTASFDFWFDYSCPYAYLASTQVAALAARTGATARMRPMLLGGVFRARNVPQNLSATLSPAKADHNARDMQRWAARYNVPLAMPSGHPLRTVEALRATLATGNDPRVIRGFFDAYWVRGEPPSVPETMRRVLREAGHDAESVLDHLEIDAGGWKDQLRRETDEAIALGVFGAPAFVVNGALYWGQDRMHFVERALGHAAHDEQTKEQAAMSGRTLELYWDFSSPYAYLASTQAEAVAKRTGATLVWRPMLLGGVFKAVGQVQVPLLTFSEAKQRHTQEDMFRWARFWNVPFVMPETFPVNSVKALRAYLALPEEKRAAYLAATFRAYWGEGKDISRDDVLAEILGEGAADVLAKTQDAAIKQELIAATQRAVDAGVFGAPTWVVDGKELFWGQDRIPLVEHALTT